MARTAWAGARGSIRPDGLRSQAAPGRVARPPDPRARRAGGESPDPTPRRAASRWAAKLLISSPTMYRNGDALAVFGEAPCAATGRDAPIDAIVVGDVAGSRWYAAPFQIGGARADQSVLPCVGVSEPTSLCRRLRGTQMATGDRTVGTGLEGSVGRNGEGGDVAPAITVWRGAPFTAWRRNGGSARQGPRAQAEAKGDEVAASGGARPGGPAVPHGNGSWGPKSGCGGAGAGASVWSGQPPRICGQSLSTNLRRTIC